VEVGGANAARMRGARPVCVYSALCVWSAHCHKLIHPKVKPLFTVSTVQIDYKDARISSPEVYPVKSVVVLLACSVPYLYSASFYLLKFAVDVHRLFCHGTESVVHVPHKQ